MDLLLNMKNVSLFWIVQPWILDVLLDAGPADWASILHENGFSKALIFKKHACLPPLFNNGQANVKIMALCLDLTR
jgi:hypothetical protein